MVTHVQRLEEQMQKQAAAAQAAATAAASSAEAEAKAVVSSAEVAELRSSLDQALAVNDTLKSDNDDLVRPHSVSLVQN